MRKCLNERMEETVKNTFFGHSTVYPRIDAEFNVFIEKVIDLYMNFTDAQLSTKIWEHDTPHSIIYNKLEVKKLTDAYKLTGELPILDKYPSIPDDLMKSYFEKKKRKNEEEIEYSI